MSMNSTNPNLPFLAKWGNETLLLYKLTGKKRPKEELPWRLIVKDQYITTNLGSKFNRAYGAASAILRDKTVFSSREEALLWKNWFATKVDQIDGTHSEPVDVEGTLKLYQEALEKCDKLLEPTARSDDHKEKPDNASGKI